MSSLHAYFAVQRLVVSSNGKLDKKRFSDEKTERQFAAKLHGYSHLPYNDMVELYKRAGMLTLVLKQVIRAVIET